MPNIRQIALDESSPNPYRQTCQTILRLVEMILCFLLVFTKYTVPGMRSCVLASIAYDIDVKSGKKSVCERGKYHKNFHKNFRCATKPEELLLD